MKSNLKIAIASSALLFSGAVCAMDFDPKFYVGADLNSNSFTLENKQNGRRGSSRNNKASLTGFLGVRLIENMGLELGYTSFSAFKDNAILVLNGQTLNSAIKLRSPHMDVVGFFPLETDFDLIASIGLGNLTGSKWKFTNASTGATVVEPKVKANALRLGFGLQYKFNENFGARAMLRYQQLDSIKLGNVGISNMRMHVGSAGLGLFYQF